MAGNKKKGSAVGGIVIFIIVAALIGGLIFYNYYTGRLLLSDPSTIGNTAANLYNLGLFCESDGRIYFSNPNDDGVLYSMSTDLKDFKRLNEDYPRYINADEHYVYYSRMNNLKEKKAESVFTFYANGIFRLKKNSKDMKMLHNKPIGSLLVYQNRLFYQYYEQNLVNIRSMGIDGEDDKELIDDESVAVSAYNGRLYYNGFKSDHYLRSIDTAGGSSRVELDQNAYNAVVTSKGTFFIDTADHYHLMFNDGSATRTLVEEQVSSYNITPDGRYIYYQKDGSDSNGIYLYDTINGSSGMILAGDYKWLNIAGGYCFFYSYDGSTVYAHKAGEGLSYFNPPKLPAK
ncbi:MAG: DUF5050 domain-containing protein [Lachnospiraceae bacterium]|nr:DUF5050 domain-containing protein [Lachnospiraceae bacterium]